MVDAKSSSHWHEIIAQLRLEAGRIMEEVGNELAGLLPQNKAALSMVLGEERQAADDIRALLAAAEVLHRRCLPAKD